MGHCLSKSKKKTPRKGETHSIQDKNSENNSPENKYKIPESEKKMPEEIKKESAPISNNMQSENIEKNVPVLKERKKNYEIVLKNIK